MLIYKAKRLALLFLVACAALSGTETTIIAHRGNSSAAPENSLAAFQSACNLDFPYIEFDVQLTKDGFPVVIHDRYLLRTTDYRFPVAVEDLTLEQIQALDCGGWFGETYKGERVLTLKELLEAPLKGIGLMIEVKEGSAPDETLAAAVVGVLSDYYQEKSVTRDIIVGSISANIVHLIKTMMPHLKTVGIAKYPPALLEHLLNDPDMIAANKDIISKKVVQSLQEKGKKVWVWTVDTSEDLNAARQCGVDGVITNCPERLTGLLAQQAGIEEP